MMSVTEKNIMSPCILSHPYINPLSSPLPIPLLEARLAAFSMLSWGWAGEGEAWSRSGAGLGNGEGRVGNGYKLDIMYQPMDPAPAFARSNSAQLAAPSALLTPWQQTGW